MEKSNVSVIEDASSNGIHRRKFFSILGGSASVVAIAAACTNNDDDNSEPYDGAVIGADGTVDLGRGDVGILNYAFALEQLEAAFYTKVVTDSAAAFSAGELALLTDIRDHEVAHREFLKAALSTKGIPALEVNFSAVNFADRNSVLSTAKTFEDLGVSAYNGAGKLMTSPDFLLLAGKIVSVEARHAAFVRDMIAYGSFANPDVVDTPSGLDVINSPATVLAAAAPFITTKISANNLPTS
jgi:hypothetical protein